MKNLVLFITCIFLGLTSIAQTNIRLIIKSDHKIDSIGMIDISQTEFHQNSFKDTVNFSFNKNDIDLYRIRYFINGKMYWNLLWLNSGNIAIKAHTDNTTLIIDTVLNSSAYYDAIAYLKYSPKLQTAKDTLLYNDYKLNEIQKNLENPRSIAIATDFINLNRNNRNELLRLKMLLSKQKADFSWFLFYSVGIERMNKILSLKEIHLSDFKFINRQDKIATITPGIYDYYILDFWYVGCAPCAQQHKAIKQEYQKLNDKKIDVIGVSIDRDFKTWNSYLSEHNYNWDNYREAGEHKLSDYLGINAFPAYVVINKKGEIIGNYDSWERVVNNLSKSP
jgi:peroxiredoxin